MKGVHSFFYINTCIKVPAMTETRYIKAMILMFSFIFLLALNNTIKPTPAPVERPAITDPKLKLPSMKSWVRIMEAAQFGIRPIRPARAAGAGCR